MDFDLTRFLIIIKAIIPYHYCTVSPQIMPQIKDGVRIRKSCTAINEKAALRTGKMGILTDILC